MAMSKKSGRARPVITLIVGSLLAVFFLYVFVFAPDTLPAWKKQMVGLACALLSGLFGFLFAGDIAVVLNLPKTKVGELGIRASGGAAVFVIVLYWWNSQFAPIAEEVTKDIRGNVTYEIGELTHTDGGPETMATAQFMANTSKLSIAVLPDAPRNTRAGWGDGMPKADGKNVFVFSSSEITMIDPGAHPTTAGFFQAPLRVYANFTAQRGPPLPVSAWRASTIEAVLITDRDSFTEGWLSAFTKASMAETDSLQAANSEFTSFYGVSPEKLADGDVLVKVYPIDLRLCIYVNGVLTAQLHGILASGMIGDEDVRKPYVTVFRQAEEGGDPSLGCA